MYVIKGHRKDGADAFIASEETGHSFVDETMDAAFVGSARSAGAILGAVSRMGTYHRGTSMDLPSFAVHRAEIEAKPVAIDDAVREKLADSDAKAPRGWRFVPMDAEGRYATPKHHWSRSTAVLSEGVRLCDLRSAVGFLDGLGAGWSLFVVRTAVSPVPLTAAELDAAIAYELEAAVAKPDEDLSDVQVYVPRL